MIRVITLIFLFILTLTGRSQEIKVTDPVGKKAVLVIQNISIQQLNAISSEFQKYSEITNATYFYKNHNCLLVSIAQNENIKFYSDLLKIIEKSTGLTSKEVLIKTPEAYNEIAASDDGSSETRFIVK